MNGSMFWLDRTTIAGIIADLESDGERHAAAAQLRELLAAQPSGTDSFQQRVGQWLLECFGPVIASDTAERNHRFLEEALELVQSCGCTASEAHQLVDYTFGRPIGEQAQEVGGVMVTLGALCRAHGLDMDGAGELELTRIWGAIDKVRAKQASKPKHSPLPELAAGGSASNSHAVAELARLQQLLNTPEMERFDEGVVVESVHQLERWGASHDAAKSPADWFWLLGYLGGKALHAATQGDIPKALHHTITSAGALRNWHRALLSQSGIEEPGSVVAPR